MGRVKEWAENIRENRWQPFTQEEIVAELQRRREIEKEWQQSEHELKEKK